MPIAYIFLSDSFNYYKSYTYDKCLGIMETSFVSCSLYPSVFLCVYTPIWRSRTFGRRRLCKRNPWRIRQSSNVYAIRGTHYFHQSNFYFKQHHFDPEKIYLLRICCIDPAFISVKKGLFSSKQHTLRNNSLHPSQRWIQLPFQLDHHFFIHPASTSILSKRPAPKRPALKSHVPLSEYTCMYA